MTRREICNLANWDDTPSVTTWCCGGPQMDNKVHPCDWIDWAREVLELHPYLYKIASVHKLSSFPQPSVTIQQILHLYHHSVKKELVSSIVCMCGHVYIYFVIYFYIEIKTEYFFQPYMPIHMVTWYFNF